MARYLDELLSSKDASHYGTTMFELARASRLVLCAERLFVSARRSIGRREGDKGF